MRDYVSQQISEQERLVTPHTMKERIRKVIEDGKFMEGTNQQVKRNRLVQYQTDFEMKIENLNYLLQQELNLGAQKKPYSLRSDHDPTASTDSTQHLDYVGLDEYAKVNPVALRKLEDVHYGRVQVLDNPLLDMRFARRLYGHTENQSPSQIAIQKTSPEKMT